MSKLTTAGAILGLVLMAGSAFGQAQGMTLQEALNTAKGQLGGAAEGQGGAANGLLILGRPELKNKVGLFGFYFYMDGKLYEIEVKGPGPKGDVEIAHITDPNPNNVKEDTVKNILEAVRKYAGAKLPMSRYLEIAKQAAGGDPTAVQLVSKDGKLVMNVTVGGQVVSIDLATGKLLGKG